MNLSDLYARAVGGIRDYIEFGRERGFSQFTIYEHNQRLIRIADLQQRVVEAIEALEGNDYHPGCNGSAKCMAVDDAIAALREELENME